MKNIIFDLDGTLIESRPRLYQLFQYMVPSSKLTFDEYWQYKRAKITHKQILQNLFSYTLKDVGEFENEWLTRIELPEWLILDKPFDGVSDYLKRLSRPYKLFIVTARQSERMALEQISQFGWLEIVEKVLVTGQKQDKYDLIKNKLILNREDWFVGDTGKDIQTGKKLCVNTAAVLSGFLSKESLLQYDPDLIEENVMKLNFN